MLLELLPIFCFRYDAVRPAMKAAANVVVMAMINRAGRKLSGGVMSRALRMHLRG